MHNAASPFAARRRDSLMPLTIVVADDDAEYREVVRYLLASAADLITIVGEAANGEEALELVLRERPDLLITDLFMPGLNGVELTRRIKRDLPQTKIILISSYPEDAYRLMASDSGADVFVSKTVVSSSLLPAIRDVIGRPLSGGSGSAFAQTKGPSLFLGAVLLQIF